MEQLVLITGGAGFIGSHVADELLRRGWRVRALDVLHPQVHGADRARPAHLARDVELVVGDVRDPDAVARALRGVRAVVHLAARVGVGQSMYELDEYVSANTRGTAVLLEALVAAKVEKLLVASSMSVYGEGAYRDAKGRDVPRATRDRERLRRAEWEPRGEGGEALVPVPTTEDKPPELESIYALTKYDQERMCLVTGRAYGIPTVALRFFNTYGPRQALGNPYTGALANFAARLLDGGRPMVFEDGRQMRDFVCVSDVARACRMALESPLASDVLNVGSGRATSVREVAERMAKLVGKPQIEPEITGRHRTGDVRHCFADVSRARARLGWSPEVTLEAGLAELAAWLDGQVVRDRASEVRAELEARGLTL